MVLFEFPGGSMLVEKIDNRLHLTAFSSDAALKNAAPLLEDVKRLAADWQCDTIETTVFDPRLASVICKLGGRVESQTVILSAE
jgi:hypothetical protein